MAYASRTDLYRLGLREAAFTGVSTADQDAALEAASDTADSYMRSRYTLPLTGYGDDLKSAVCKIAAYELLRARGYSPNAGGDESLKDGRDEAVTWLGHVSSGRAHVSGGNTTPAATRHARASSPRVDSNRTRGW
jgi:phage gp36-like protein